MNTHPSKVHRQRENYESFMSERGDGSYIIIGTPSNGNRSNNGRAGDDDFDNDTRKQTVKMESNDSPKHTSFSSGKKDGNVWWFNGLILFYKKKMLIFCLVIIRFFEKYYYVQFIDITASEEIAKSQLRLVLYHLFTILHVTD